MTSAQTDFEVGQLWSFGAQRVLILEGPVNRPLWVLREDYDEHNGPDDPPSTAYEPVDRLALRVEWVPQREEPEPEGGHWIDESCFGYMKPLEESAP